MAATLGRIEEFDGDKEEWSQYQERLEYFFQANEIEDGDKKRAVFLSLIGSNTYKRLRNLIAPEKPDTKTYAQLVKALADHFSPTPTESVQRFKFHSRVRKPGESVATFVSELRCLAEFCKTPKLFTEATTLLATQGGIHAVCLTVVFVCRASASPWSSGDFARGSRSFRELQRHSTE
ncbi:MAG: hypothetical protein MPL62_11380 [Alphaproteobacteria bacterium]|nr:hypothetical protein [Alphaproteobacteria bacterium]